MYLNTRSAQHSHWFFPAVTLLFTQLYTLVFRAVVAVVVVVAVEAAAVAVAAAVVVAAAVARAVLVVAALPVVAQWYLANGIALTEYRKCALR